MSAAVADESREDQDVLESAGGEILRRQTAVFDEAETVIDRQGASVRRQHLEADFSKANVIAQVVAHLRQDPRAIPLPGIPLVEQAEADPCVPREPIDAERFRVADRTSV